jgi:hypothetical protein
MAPHDTALRHRHRSAVLQTIICAVAAENIRYFQPRAIHFPPSLYKYRAFQELNGEQGKLGGNKSGGQLVAKSGGLFLDFGKDGFLYFELVSGRVGFAVLFFVFEQMVDKAG